jgi:hypothetical protein
MKQTHLKPISQIQWLTVITVKSSVSFYRAAGNSCVRFTGNEDDKNNRPEDIGVLKQ